MTIEEKIDNIKKEILALKARQRTQNDSYEFYAYQSENLWGRYWDSISVEFIPYSRKKEDVVVSFDCSGGNIVQFNEVVTQTTIDPLKGECEIMANQAFPGQSDFWHGSQGQEYPDWAKYFYISCYSNCKGELRLTFNGNGTF